MFFNAIIFVPFTFKYMPTFSGWNQLVEKYPSNEEVRGTVLLRESAIMKNFFSYASVLKFVINEDGMGISTCALFRKYHKNVFIPWCDIRFEQERALTRKLISLSISSIDCPFRITEKAFIRINQILKGFDKEIKPL